MGTKIPSYKFLISLSIILLGNPAFAQVPDLEPLNYQLRYDVSWSGIALGRIRITVTEDMYGYKMSVDTKTKGIARLFDKTKGLAETTGKIAPEGYVPQHYSSSSKDDEGGRTTTVTYESDGSIRARDRNPPDDPARRPPVPIEQASTGVDPITTFLKMRRGVHDHMEQNIRETEVMSYDGARLAQFTTKVVSRASLESMDKHVNAINTVLTRRPIAGYKDKEIAKYEKGDPVVHIYYSADGRFIPLKADIKLSYGTISLELVEIQAIK